MPLKAGVIEECCTQRMLDGSCDIRIGGLNVSKPLGRAALDEFRVAMGGEWGATPVAAAFVAPQQPVIIT